jgi:predicted dehydrogenase
MKSENIVIVGLGAIAEALYLPYFAGTLGRQLRSKLVCVDLDGGQLKQATERFDVARLERDYTSTCEGALLAVVATPPTTHATIAAAFLQAGAHVIVEKPLTNQASEGHRLAATALQADRLLMVNNTRRMFQSYQEIRRILHTGELGDLISIDYSEGGIFAWPTASGFYFDAKSGGRGVIADRGSHVLDLFCWWTGESPQLTQCLTDADGGVEGFCDVRLQWPKGAMARMRLSWHNKLANKVVIKCTNGEIRCGIYDYRDIVVVHRGKTLKRRLAAEERCFEDYGRSFVAGALAAAEGRGEPPVRGEDVIPSLELIDACYQNAGRIDFPWLFNRRSAAET